jgi:1,4-dihydroxy-2-naphthoate octaprenyltransferase
MNVLLINGHPCENSLSDAFAHAYSVGATKAGVQIKRINIRDCHFDPNERRSGNGTVSRAEEDILEARQLILWAEHVVFFYPVWWGTMPALLKGFIDRTFISDFAFREIEGGTGYAPLLNGRSAQLVITLDTPYLVYKLIYRAPGNNAMKRSTLGFCGFQMGPTLHFGPVKKSTPKQRISWVRQVEKAGEKLKDGRLPFISKFTYQLTNWIRAIRLQFYPMTFLAYLLGALATGMVGLSFDKTIFWTGYFWIFFLEIATVLSNDYFDYETDKANAYFSPFTGGSRVLVEKRISAGSMKTAIILFVLLAVAALVLVLIKSPGSFTEIAIASATLFLLALGYTIPPVKLVYRGLGEITVCLTHSFAVILAGYIFQGGSVNDIYPWLFGIPLFLIPDQEADKLAGKKTLAVRFGKRKAAIIALAIMGLSVLSIIIIQLMLQEGQVFRNLLFFIVPHALFFTYYWMQIFRRNIIPHRIDTIMVLSLTYIIWFVVVPLFNIL